MNLDGSCAQGAERPSENDGNIKFNADDDNSCRKLTNVREASMFNDGWSLDLDQ